MAYGLTAQSVQGATIGVGQPFRRMILDPGDINFESRNPGALQMLLSRIKSIGTDEEMPDLCFAENYLINEDRVLTKVQTQYTKDRDDFLSKLKGMDAELREEFGHLNNEDSFKELMLILNERKALPTTTQNILLACV